MEYKATFKSMLGLTILFLFIGFITIPAGIQADAPELIIIGLLAFALLLVIRIRFKVTVTDRQITSTGFFRTKRINLNEITGGCWMIDKGYPKNRSYGAFVYEIQTTRGIMRINFKLFPIECMENILKIMEE